MIKMIQSSLICPECGNIFPIMRKNSRQRELFHIKSLYCPFCKKVTDHIEARNLDFLIEVISRKEEKSRNTEEQKVYSLVKKRSELYDN